MRVRTLVQNTNLVTVAQARVFALSIVAAATDGLDADGPRPAFLVLYGDVKRGIGVALYIDIRAPGVRCLDAGLAGDAGYACGAQIHRPATVDDDFIAIRPENVAG